MYRLLSGMIVLSVFLTAFSGCVDEDRDAAYREQVRQDYSDQQATLAGYRATPDQVNSDSTLNSK